MRHVAFVTCTLLAAFVLTLQAQYDVLIRDGRMLDGTGNPWRYADIAISGDRVVRIGTLDTAHANRIIDARGLYVAPGFIDVHSHAAGGLASSELSHAQPLLAQGITTVIVNPDGGGPVDLEEQRERLLEHGLGVNVVLMVPHGSIRRTVIGMENRRPTHEELERMRELVRRGMDAGAFGLSSGLYYAPGSYAETEEVIALAKVAGTGGGVYTSHIRDEADYSVGVVAAVDEVIRIAEEAELPGIVTHVKALGPRVWGYAGAIVERIRRARERGIQVFVDQYPYAASGTSITGALVPRWALVGGHDALLKRMNMPETRARLRSDIVENLDRRGGAARLQFQFHDPDPSIEGKIMLEVAEERGMEPVDLVLELLQAGETGLVSFNMNDRDMHLLMRQPWTMTSSDGGLTTMGRGVPHPRYYGTFPRKIRMYVLDRGIVTLENAVRGMTSLSASVFSMADRGMLREGAVADVVVFDLASVRDRATYADPHQLSEGIVYLLVNGELAIDDGRFTNVMSGRVLGRGGRDGKRR